MTRRIPCYVVFVTLIWGAHTDDEGKVRDMFKSNMTRNDFSNLLQSLIKLNEQRVNVLQKLYRLEDYGVLSEVLRSGDKKTGNGNPNNLFLIVMSKNQNDPSRRKIGFQLVDSVSSLNAGSNNNHSKLDFFLDLAGYFNQNIGKENRLLDSIFGNFSRVGPTKKHRADDGSKKISTTKETLKFNKPGLRAEVKHDSNVLRAATRLKANEESKYHKENSRHEIVNNKGRRPNTNEKLLGYDGNRNHPQTVGYNSQSNEYVETDFTIENEKLTTKPKITKHITSNHNSKYPSKGKNDEDGYGSPLSHVKNYQNRQYTKIIRDISIKKYHVSNHFNSKTNTYTPKVKVHSNQQNDKLTTKPIIIKDILSSNHKKSKYPLEGSPFSHSANGHNRQYTKIISDISIKKQHGKNHKTSKYTPKVKVRTNQQNDKMTTKLILVKDILSNHKNPRNPLEGKDEQDKYVYGSPLRNIENGHNSQHTKMDSDISVEKLHSNNHYNPKINKYNSKVKVQSNEENGKLTNKRIIIKHILSRNHKKSKYLLEGKDAQIQDAYGSPFSNIESNHYSQYGNINSDIPKLHVNNHQKLKTTTKPITIKYIITSNHKNTKYPSEGKDEPEEDDYGSPFSSIENDHYSQYTNKNSDISIKKHHDNNHKTNKYTTKVKVQSNQQNDKLTTKPITIKDIITSKHKNTKYLLEAKDDLDEGDYGSPLGNIENDHYSQYTNKNSDIFIKKLHVNNHNSPKTIENTPKVNIQRNRQPKLNQNKSVLNNQGNKYSKIKTVKTTTPKKYYRINGTVKKTSEKNQVIKNPNLNHNNTNSNNDDLTYTSIKYEYATKDTKLPSLASENVYGSKPVISEITKDTQNGSYPDYDYRIIGSVKKASENNQVIKDLNLNHNNTNANNDDLTYTSIKDEYATKNTKLPSLASENVYSSKPVISKITKDTENVRYPDFGDHKDIRDNSNKDEPETVTDTLYGNYPQNRDHKDVRDNSNKDKPETTIGTLFGNNFHGFEHHNNVMKNLNKNMSNTVKELHQRNNPNVKSEKDTDYYGVKMFDNGKSDEEFSIFITNVGNRTAEEVKQQNDPQLTLNTFDKPRSKHIARKPFAKCLNKKALKLCCKSCISAYKNVCRKLKCTSRSKKALKSECKRSCKKTFASSSSKYSDEYSGRESSSDAHSDESNSDYS